MKPTLTDKELTEIVGRGHAFGPDDAAVFLRLQPDLEPFVNAVNDRNRLIVALRASRAEAERLAAIESEVANVLASINVYPMAWEFDGEGDADSYDSHERLRSMVGDSHHRLHSDCEPA